MKVYAVEEGFGLDHLTLAERPIPEPGPGEVLVRIRAVSLNYRDLLTVQGAYNPRQPLPLVPCSDAVGEVVARGESVTRVEVGQRVAPIFSQRWIAGRPSRKRLRSTLGGPADGTLAEYAVFPAESVVTVPEHLSEAEAATLPCAGVTAWSALEEAAITAGDTVLTLGTGGVSIFALQLATLRGARVIITSSSDDKLARASELGAWQGVNYEEHPEWGRVVKELVPGGVDLVVEVGGAETLTQSLRSVRMGGTVAVIGNLTGRSVSLDLALVFMQGVRLQGTFVGPRERFEALNRAVAQHRMRPVVDRVFAFDDVHRAFALLAEGGHLGKVVVAVGPEA